MISASSLRGGNLASITHAGHFLSDLPVLQREKNGRQTHNRLLASAARISIALHDAAQHLFANNTNGHHASRERLGAAGLVLRLPRLLPFLQINHVSHLTPPCEVNSIGAAFPRGGFLIREERNGPHI
jgi:hypothetical protein